MVLRRTIVYTVVYTLLLCPYPCLAQAADICCDAECDCQKEDQCRTTRLLSGTSNNLPGDSGCCLQSGTCLCHGGILEHSKVLIDVDTSLVAPLPIDALLIFSESVGVDAGFLKERTACHFPSVESGRKVRALIESFLL